MEFLLTHKCSEYCPSHANLRLFSVYTYMNTARRKLLNSDTPYVCKICSSLPVWQGKALTLHVDHEDGNKNNNDISNLRYLCPNCHSQTETYCALNRNGAAANFKKRPINELQVIISTMTYNEICDKYGLSPNGLSNCLKQLNLVKPTVRRSAFKIDWPSDQEFTKMVQTMSMKKVSKILNVSDKAVQKRCVKLNIPRSEIWGLQRKNMGRNR